MKNPTIATAAFVSCLLLGCSGPRGRIMSDTEQDYVGNRSAGAATFDQLVSGVTQRMLSEQSAARTGLDQLQIVVLPVENASAEELGDWQEQIYELIQTTINRAERYAMVSPRFVDAALREVNLRPEELFIPNKRRQLLAVLEREGTPVDALVFPKLTSGSTFAAEDTTQRDYLLTLELVGVESGRSERFSQPVRKQYER